MTVIAAHLGQIWPRKFDNFAGAGAPAHHHICVASTQHNNSPHQPLFFLLCAPTTLLLRCIPPTYTFGSRSSEMSIHLLADQGDKSGVAQCIAARANVNEADTTGQKPLHYAAAKGYVTIFISTFYILL